MKSETQIDVLEDIKWNKIVRKSKSLLLDFFQGIYAEKW